MGNVNNYTKSFLDGLSSTFGANLNNIPSALLLAIICYGVYKIIFKIFEEFSKRVKIDQNILKVVASILKFLIIFFSIMMIASSLGINTSSLIAAFSIFGIAISLSVQNLMSNIANAISIYANKPFKVGDYVKIGDVEGTVAEIGFMLTKIRTYKNEIIYIPNTSVGSSIIINYSESPIRRIEQIIDASYNDPIDKVKSAIMEAINNEPLVLKNEEIYIAVVEYSTSSIQYDVRVYCETANFLKCKNSLFERYKTSFDKNGITIPFKTLNVNITK